jgi:hypothetical protein
MKKCLICNKKVTKDPRLSKRQWNKRKFCSNGCFYKWEKKRRPVKCLFCGKEFEPAVALVKKGYGKFCSSKCYGKSMLIYEGIKAIRNQYKTILWRRKIVKRDKYCCIKCGSKKELCADHIKPVATYPELAFDINNGRTLCKECHKKTDSYGWNFQKNNGKITK